MTEKLITVENVGKRAFIIKKENEKGKKVDASLRPGSVYKLPQKQANKLLELYPLELRDLDKIVKTVESNNDKELRKELEKKSAEFEKLTEKYIEELKKKEKEIKELKEINEDEKDYEEELEEKDVIIEKLTKELNKLKTKK
jgi:hypothetical protein